MSTITSDQVFLLLMIGASLWIARRWTIDYRAALDGKPNERPLPGATSVAGRVVTIAALGALFILAVETAGEHALALSAEQSKVTVLFGLYSVLGAPVIEEVLFRGYFVIEKRGHAALWGGVVGASLLFALLHPFLLEWNGGSPTVQFDAKAWFSTTASFIGSLWLYTVRFFGLNPRRSLLPCFVAHTTKNLGVFAIKFAQGFVGGWW